MFDNLNYEIWNAAPSSSQSFQLFFFTEQMSLHATNSVKALTVLNFKYHYNLKTSLTLNLSAQALVARQKLEQPCPSEGVI